MKGLGLGVLLVIFANSAAASSMSRIELLSSEAQKKQKADLVQEIKYGLLRCSLRKDDTKETCLKELADITSSVLTCDISEDRWLEMAEIGRNEQSETLKKQTEVPVPAHIQNLMKDVIKAGEAMVALSAHSGEPLPLALFPKPQWSLKGYKDTAYNAFASSGGAIVISSKFWSEDNTYSDNETRAILAHEVSHVILNHNLQLGCVALEWVQGPNLKDSLARFEAWGPGAVAASQVAQANELQADQYGMKLLVSMGHNPKDMVEALKKLHPEGDEGGTFIGEATHPETGDRIRRADSFRF